MSAARAKLHREADQILAAANDNRPQKPRAARFRGGYPALTWLLKRDQDGAAALWRLARQAYPQAANDNQSDAAGLNLDRRDSGKPRGAEAPPTDVKAYIDLPSVQPRLGDDVQRRPAVLQGYVLRYDLKPQVVEDVPLHPDCCFGFGAPAVAQGAFFLGAASGLGSVKAGKSRGDIRRVDEPDKPVLPDEVETVIEALLARCTLAQLGEALGASRGYADRKGGAALLTAAAWARANVPNRAH